MYLSFAFEIVGLKFKKLDDVLLFINANTFQTTPIPPLPLLCTCTVKCIVFQQLNLIAICFVFLY